MGPNEQALNERIEKIRAEGGRVHFSWAENAHEIPIEDRCAEALKWLDENDAYNALPEIEKMRRDVEFAYKALKNIMGKCQHDIMDNLSKNDWELTEIDALKSEIWCAAEMASLQLGNWVKR